MDRDGGEKIDTELDTEVACAPYPIAYRARMATIERFKDTIVRIRDILRSMSITGMDSMRHICLYLLARSLTREKAALVGLPDKFAWESIMETLRSRGISLTLEAFRNATDDCLVAHFDRLFGTDKFPFDINKEVKHKEILEALDRVNLTEVDCEMDILGWVYEQHLQTGSKAARDLGQFFTDRSICTYMVDMCKPKFKSAGVPETVCDPTMGTGGFLTAYIKFFEKKYSDTINWAVQEKEIHGCDTDPKVAAVARLNFFLETGSRSSNLLTQDSLYEDLPQTQYDIILANMPFGVKGLKYADCCARVKALRLDGTKSEPLFLQLMLVSLAPGGRCAVVVPDGMLFNSSKCHNGTRKYLLDHFDKVRVIKMEGKFFMNTSIKPSILYFENTGSATSTVEFWEAEKNEKGEIRETLIVSVPRASIEESCTLDVRRYTNVTHVTKYNEYPVATLETLCRHQNGKTLSSEEKVAEGEYDVMGGGLTYNGRTTHYNREGETISISKSGASAGFIAYHNKKYWAGDCMTLVPMDPGAMLTKYIYYALRLDNGRLIDKTAGSTIPHCKWDDIRGISISVPPRSIQAEIVATLDRLFVPGTSDLTGVLRLTDRAMDLVLARPDGSTLEPVVEALRLAQMATQTAASVRKQMTAIMQATRHNGSPLASLEAVCTYQNGKTLSSEEKVAGGEYDVMGGGLTYNGKTTRYNREGETVSISKSGASAGFVAYHNKKYWAGDCMTLVPADLKTMLTKYLYYALRLENYLLTDKTAGSTIPHCKWDDIREICIPAPSVETQAELVARLDALQTQINALEALQTQAEDNARFILESYLAGGETVPAGAGAGAGAASVKDVEANTDEDDGSALGGAGVPTATMPAPAAKAKLVRKPKATAAKPLVVDTATLAEAVSNAVVITEAKPKRGRKPKAAAEAKKDE